MSFEKELKKRHLLFLDLETSGLTNDCVIYTIGYSFGLGGEIIVGHSFEISDPVEAEKNTLEKFIREIEGKKLIFVTYCGYVFDMRLLLFKSIKYNMNSCVFVDDPDHNWHLDLVFLWEKMRIGRTGKRFSDMAKFLGILHEDKYAGGLIPHFYRKGEYDKIIEHQRKDIELLKKVYVKLDSLTEYMLKRRYGGS